jgi:signal transduction histidine kinase
MGRYLIPAGVVLADTAVLVAGHRGGLPLWVVAVFALAVVLVIALRSRAPVAALVAALVLASVSGGAYVLLLWAAYRAGRDIASRPGLAMAAGAALGCLGAQLAVRPADTRSVLGLVCTYAVFVALPLLAGRYQVQQQRLVAALNQHNRQLRWKREALADQERLNERLRIARDMHDSLGRRLSLVSIQAAALEVSALPPPQRHAVGQLAAAARRAADELYEVIGVLRNEDIRSGQPPGPQAIGKLVEEFRAAGVQVTLRRHGESRSLSAAAAQAAYRVVEEGLTNAAKHARDQPVTVSVEWEPGTLLLTVINAVPGHQGTESTQAARGAGARQGLCGLSERIGSAGGFFDHGLSGRQFRLVAMLPAAGLDPADPDPNGPDSAGPDPSGPDPSGPDPSGPGPTAAREAAGDDALPPAGPVRTAALGIGTAALMFMILPATMLLGVR